MLVAFRRSLGDEQRLVLVNFTDAAVDVTASADLAAAPSMHVALASDGSGEGSPFSGSVGPDQAVVLSP